LKFSLTYSVKSNGVFIFAAIHLVLFKYLSAKAADGQHQTTNQFYLASIFNLSATLLSNFVFNVLWDWRLFNAYSTCYEKTKTGL